MEKLGKIEKLDWEELEDRKESAIKISRGDFNLSDDTNWESDFEWLEQKNIKMKKGNLSIPKY